MTKLIVLAGLPAVGKSTIAREVARRTGATWLRIDSMDQAIWASGTAPADLRDWTVRAAQSIAADNLLLGRDVVADCVNDWAGGRKLWSETGERVGVTVRWLEVICGDLGEHRRRVETRKTNVDGLTLPDWPAVLARQFDPWEQARIVLDTAHKDPESSVEEALAALEA
jgi:predicted kinase